MNRISTDYLVDVIASKTLAEKLVNIDEDNKIKGIVQHTFLDPFGYVLLSDIQVNIYFLNYVFYSTALIPI